MNAPTAKPLDLAQFEGHTPGPFPEGYWHVCDAENVSSTMITQPAAMYVKAGQLDVAAIVLFPAFEKKAGAMAQQRANLFAAAPALLALAKEQRTALEEADNNRLRAEGLIDSQRAELALEHRRYIDASRLADDRRLEIAKLRDQLSMATTHLELCATHAGIGNPLKDDVRQVAESARAALKEPANG